MLTPAERADQLAEDVVHVLQRVAAATTPEGIERCLGCGDLTDPDKPCPICTILTAERRRSVA